MTEDPPWLRPALAEIRETAARSSGPGGQHVNKTSTAVELRLDVEGSAAIPAEVKRRLSMLAGRRLSLHGTLLVVAQGYRSQEMNRREGRSRIEDLLRQAAHRPKIRRPTKPSLASKGRRLGAKLVRGKVKSLRARPSRDED